MTTEKVRVINLETGKVKFLAPHVAADTAQLFAYGFIVQDLQKKEFIEDSKPNKKPKEIIQDELDLLDMQENKEETAKGKPGRKPNAKQ